MVLNQDDSVISMLSKPGKYSDEKYSINERINEPKKSVVKLQKPKEEMEDIDQVPQKKNKIIQPLKFQTSRDQAQRIKSIKNPPPAIGHYRPKYNEIDKKTHHTNIYYDHLPHQNRKQKEELGDIEYDMSVIPNKLSKKIRGVIKFDKYSKRPEFKSQFEVNENRFEQRSVSYHSSSIQKPRQFKMDKTVGRNIENTKNTYNLPDYNPKYDLIQQKIVKQIPQFNKQTNRVLFQDDKKEPDFKNFNQFDYGQFQQRENSQVFAKVRGMSFSKQLSKYSDQNTHLPSFMQKTVANRHALNLQNQKCLENNNYSDSKYQKDYSSFSQHQSFNKKKNKDAPIDYEYLERILDEF